MNTQRNNNLLGLFFVLFCLVTASAFQQKSTPCLSSLTASSPLARSYVLLSSMPPNYDDNEFDAPPQSIPKLKLPTPSMPEIDVKESLKKFAILGVTVLVFLAIQKGGLILSDIFTPELSEEQVSNFRL